MLPRKENVMWKICVLSLILFFPLSFLSAQELIEGKRIKKGMWENREIEYLEGEIAVILKPGVSKADVLPLLQRYGATIKRDFDKLGWGLVELPASTDLLFAAAEWQQNPLLQIAEPNMVTRTADEPNDEFYQDGHQWALKNWGQDPPAGTVDADIDTDLAWEITRGSSDVIIAILDTGIPLVGGSLSHPDLDDPNKFILGPDYIDPGQANGVKDQSGHGTHVTGIASAETDNLEGVAGVAGGSSVMVIQVFSASGQGSWSAFRDGVIYAVDNGATVINYSGGDSAPSGTAEQAVQYAYNNDVLLIASAGNDCENPVYYPAAYSDNYSNVIAVSATNHHNVIAEYSNIGPQINVSAPGGHGTTNFCQTGYIYYDADDIYSTTPNYSFNLQNTHPEVTQNYGYLAGTSMAAPHVSGLAALLISMYPTWTPAQIRERIESTALDLGAPGFDNYYGYGRIDAWEALRHFYVPQDYPTIQEAINAAVSGCIVHVSSGSYTENLYMKPGVWVEGAGENATTINGTVTFNNDDDAGLWELKVNKKISVTNSDYVDIGIKAGSSNCYIDVSGSWVDVDFIISTVSRSQGIYAHNYSDIGVWGGSITNKSIGINQYLSSDTFVEGVYFCQNYFDISAGSGCSADAYLCTFSSSREGGSVEGDVYWEDWDWCGLSKQAVMTLGKNGALTGADPGASEYKEAMSIYHTIKRSLRQDRLSAELVNPKKYAAEFASAIDKFKKVVADYPESSYAISSVGRIAAAYRVLNEFKPLENYVQMVANSRELNPLRPYALSALIPSYIDNEMYSEAIALSDRLINEFPKHLVTVELIYGKGLIYKYHLSDADKAGEMFEMVIQQYPDHPTAQSARDELEHKNEYLAKDAVEAQGLNELSVQNYPNPFNPETRIQFTLSEPGRVVLKIFDILGREVKTLVDEKMRQGHHTVSWDSKNNQGFDVASGTYFMQIRFKEQTLTRKMLLLR